MKSQFAFALPFAMLLLVTAQLYGQSQSKQMAPKQQRQLTLGQVVGEASAVSMSKVDHSDWNRLLQAFVDESGAVNYAQWNDSQQGKQLLDKYINQLSTASLKKAATRVDQMAYWINAYNAVTIKGILQEYPTTSIRNHTSENGGYNIWKNLLLNVGGQQVSLDAIEHKALRPMGDPRIHFAIVCASKGCPRLLNKAFVGETLNEQLDENARYFFSVAQNFQHDPRTRSFKVSSILQWFGTDFGANQAAQLNAIAKFLPTKEAQAAATSNAVSVSYLDYSWELNEQPKVMKKAAGSGSKKMTGSDSKTSNSGSDTRRMKKIGSSKK